MLSLSTWWGGRVNVTCWHRDACRCCLPAAETHFSALVETDRRFSALVETGFSALVETDRRFSALVETGFSALVEADRRFSALVETETRFCFLMEADTCFSVDLLLHFRFLGVRLTSADRARGGGGVIDSCGGCDAVSTATYAASAVSEMGTCGDALSKTTCAASAVSGKCQRRGPVSSRHPVRMGCPLG